MIQTIRKLVEPLNRRVMLMIGRGIIRVVNDALPYQNVQASGLAGELLGSLDRFQQYGFTSVPFAGAEAVIVFPGGNRSAGIVIACEDKRYRLTGLANGEVALYDDQEQKVHITRTGIVVNGINVTVNATTDATVNAGTLAKVAAPAIEVRATESLKLDCGGNAEEWTPATRTTYFSGTSSTLPSHPPAAP